MLSFAPPPPPESPPLTCRHSSQKLRKKKGLSVVEWGKYGLIAENDIYSKDQEFRAWLVGEKMVNPETLSKAKEKEIFKTFMEEYNTGSPLPHLGSQSRC